ncbi:unnamed protein product, partial [Cyprideis torosa]
PEPEDDSAWILRADFMEYDAQPMHQDLLPPLLIRKRKRFRDDLMSPRRAAFALESDCLLRGSYQRAQRPTTSRRQSTGSGKTGNHGHEMGVGNGGCRGLLPTFSSDSLPPAPGPVPLLGPSYPIMGRGSSAMIAASPIQTWSLFDPPVTTHVSVEVAVSLQLFVDDVCLNCVVKTSTSSCEGSMASLGFTPES